MYIRICTPHWGFVSGRLNETGCEAFEVQITSPTTAMKVEYSSRRRVLQQSSHDCVTMGDIQYIHLVQCDYMGWDLDVGQLT